MNLLYRLFLGKQEVIKGDPKDYLTVRFPNAICVEEAKKIREKSEKDFLFIGRCKNYILGKLNYSMEYYKPFNYTPDLDRCITEGKGFCVDYAEMFCNMLRAGNVPCAVVYGYVNDIYHAWNVVYMDGRWYRYDLVANENGASDLVIRKEEYLVKSVKK